MMRSYTGCSTCRGRKLKCDQAKPICGACRKSSRGCSYLGRSIFRNFQLHPSPKRSRPSTLQNSSSPRPSEVEESHTSIQSSSEFTFVYENAPHSPPGDESPRENYALATLAPEQYASWSHHGSNTSSPSPLGESTSHHSETAPSLPNDDNNSATDVPQSVLDLHLFRYFKNGPGIWMDLFDTSAYFSSKVPVIATTRPLLKSAVCSLAAKYLHHQAKISSEIKRSPLLSHVDWHYQSAKHYDQALGQLHTTLHTQHYASDITKKEEVFAAVAILCTYELMDAPGTEWKVHLNALPLFSAQRDFSAAHSPVASPYAAVAGPIFWSLARQDLLCAFISETQTQLDLKDMVFWRNGGMVMDESGLLLPFNPLSPNDLADSADMAEDVRSNELTRILGKIANFIASGDAVSPEQFALPRGQRSQVAVPQEQLLERWEGIMAELERWHDNLPPSFEAASRTRVPEELVNSQEGTTLDAFNQVWYTLPLCAALIQSYHEAIIILLVNKPHESTAMRTTVSYRLRSYRDILQETHRHAREICNISLADPTDSVRVNSPQALFVAGQVFDKEGDQNVILHLLTNIERDLGWTTSYYINKLLAEWGR